MFYAYFRQAGEHGDCISFLNLSIMTELGRGVRRDGAAARLYKQLAHLAYSLGQNNLAHMLDKGLGGLTTNHAQAL